MTDHGFVAQLQRGFVFDDGTMLPWRSSTEQLRMAAPPDHFEDNGSARVLGWFGRKTFGGLLHPVYVTIHTVESDTLEDVYLELAKVLSIADAAPVHSGAVVHLGRKLGQPLEQQAGFCMWRKGGVTVELVMQENADDVRVYARVCRRR